MKTLCCCLLLVATSTAFGTTVGDTYEKVIAEKGKPKSVVELGSRQVLQYPDVSITLQDNVVSSVRIVTAPPAPPPAPPVAMPANQPAALTSTGTSTSDKVAALQQQLEAAAGQVQRIVNQSVSARERTSEMRVGQFSPGWFHDGAATPDFNTVDVRRSQQFPYDSYVYVTSDLNPGIVFLGRELEFNPMTKIFYADRSVPKKRLTEGEMLEINRLYRIIGQCEQQLAPLQGR